MENEEELKKAKQEYEKIKQDEHERYLAELREKHIRDTVTIREDGFNEGVQKGIEEGIKKGMQKANEYEQKLIKIVENMHAKNKSIQEIREITELTEEEIQKIINS